MSNVLLHLKTIHILSDIQVPYNAERLLYFLTNRNTTLITEWYQQLTDHGGFDLPSEWWNVLRRRFASARVTDEEMCATIRQVYEITDDAYLIDPHTAVALTALAKQADDCKFGHSKRPVALLSTASACKFEEAVTQAVGQDAWRTYVKSPAFSDAARAIMMRPERPPLRYHRSPGQSLAEAQVAWEAETRQLLA
jgi:threonine synthase